MNIVRIRESIAELQKNKIISESYKKKLLESPVFEYTDDRIEGDDYDAMIEFLKGRIFYRKNPDDGRDWVHTPYPVFTVHCNNPSLYIDNAARITFLIQSFGIPFQSATKEYAERFSKVPVSIMALITTDDKRNLIFSVDYSGYSGKQACLVRGWSGFKCVSEDSAFKNNSAKCAEAVRMFVYRFLYKCMSRSHVIVRVRPESKGRSVEWVIGREHYLLAPRRAVVQARDSKSPLLSENLARAAGWRRKHQRTLRSDRFTKKKGQTIWVRETWVGPEEWEGLDGKVYKVMLKDAKAGQS